MTLRNHYEEIKNRQVLPLSIWILTIGLVIAILASYAYLIYCGWHYLISKIFNIPDMNYFQVCGILIWALILKIGVSATNGKN